jgi:hypothetical protein
MGNNPKGRAGRGFGVPDPKRPFFTDVDPDGDRPKDAFYLEKERFDYCRSFFRPNSCFTSSMVKAIDAALRHQESEVAHCIKHSQRWGCNSSPDQRRAVLWEATTTIKDVDPRATHIIGKILSSYPTVAWMNGEEISIGVGEGGLKGLLVDR